jgi:ribokinase
MIHVVGNVAIDTVVRVARFANPGETIIADGAVEDIGGKGSNQAVVIARAGVPVRLVAAIGNDAGGQSVRERLSQEGVITDGLWTWSGPTDRCIIQVDARGENTIVSLIGAAQAFDPLAMTDLAHRVGPGDTLLFQGNLRPDVLRRCLAFARERGATTVLNPSPISAPEDYDWDRVDVAVMNAGEAETLTCEAHVVPAAERLHGAGAKVVVVTMGAAGPYMSTEEQQYGVLHLRPDGAPPPPVVDTTGAGDVFAGALIAARVSGLGWGQALGVASDAASLSVTRPGVLASFPSAVEMAEFIWHQRARSEAPVTP